MKDKSGKQVSKEPATVSRLPRRASRERLETAEHRRTVWNYFATAGTAIEEVLKPAFWAPVSSRFEPWHRIEICEESGQWWGELLVQAVVDGGAVVHQLRFVELGGVGKTGALPSNATGARIEFLGAHRRWALVAADGRVLKDQLPREIDARRELESLTLVNQNVTPHGEAS